MPCQSKSEVLHLGCCDTWTKSSQLFLTASIARWICGYSYFIATSKIANDLRLISNLQYGLHEHLIVSPCCEEELASLFLDTEFRNSGFYSGDIFHCHQPDRKQSQINFKLVVRAEWTSTLITMLWGRAGFSLLGWQGSRNIIFTR